MSIQFDVLGSPGRDNALFVELDTGHSVHHLLFDCGHGCLDAVPISHRQEIEAVFFSHFHVDHIAGFDGLLRFNWSRNDPAMRVFGPDGTIEVVHHRLRGYTWDLVEDSYGEWYVSEICDGVLRTVKFLSQEGFSLAHPVDEVSRQVVYETDAFQIFALPLKHSTISMAYHVRERERCNIDTQVLAAMALPQGPWLNLLKDVDVEDAEEIELGGNQYRVGELRSKLLTTAVGDSVAYLTDFCLQDQHQEAELIEFLSGCQTLICENNYADSDLDLAQKNFHMTSSQVGRLASRVNPDALVLFHLSDRYSQQDWAEQIRTVRSRFPPTVWPKAWRELFGETS